MACKYRAWIAWPLFSAKAVSELGAQLIKSPRNMRKGEMWAMILRLAAWCKMTLYGLSTMSDRDYLMRCMPRWWTSVSHSPRGFQDLHDTSRWGSTNLGPLQVSSQGLWSKIGYRSKNPKVGVPRSLVTTVGLVVDWILRGRWRLKISCWFLDGCLVSLDGVGTSIRYSEIERSPNPKSDCCSMLTLKV